MAITTFNPNINTSSVGATTGVSGASDNMDVQAAVARIADQALGARREAPAVSLADVRRHADDMFAEMDAAPQAPKAHAKGAATVQGRAADAFADLDQESVKHPAPAPQEHKAADPKPAAKQEVAQPPAPQEHKAAQAEVAQPPAADPAPAAKEEPAQPKPAETAPSGTAKHQPGDYSWIKNPSLRRSAEDNYKRAHTQDQPRAEVAHPTEAAKPTPSAPTEVAGPAPQAKPTQTNKHQPGDFSWIKNPSLRHSAEENYKRSLQLDAKPNGGPVEGHFSELQPTG